MSPAFQRGDVCLVWNRSEVVNVGDIPVVWFQRRDLPMVRGAVTSRWKMEEETNGNAE